MKIGFIGQGYIGKNYADDFENRGYSVVRYALEEPYNGNGSKISDCEVVFVAVPTPTTSDGFDSSIVEGVLDLVVDGATVVIKSTVLPGTTERLQKENERIYIVYSPEFLCEVTAAEDAAHPFSNIIGIPFESKENIEKAKQILDILPNAPFSHICSSTEAEIIKYTHNVSAYTQIITFNIAYDLARSFGYKWDNIGKALQADPMISNQYSNPVHKSGRGAGGNCFVKDFESFRQLYKDKLNDTAGSLVLESLKNKNVELLLGSNKDIGILKGVYGNDVSAEKKQ